MAEAIESCLSPLQFFEAHIRDIVFRTLKIRCKDGGLPICSPVFCKFTALSNPRLQKSRVIKSVNRKNQNVNVADLKVKLFGQKLCTEDLLVLKDEISQNDILKPYFFSADIDQFNNILLCLNRKVFIKNVLCGVIASDVKFGQEKAPLGSSKHQFLVYNENITMNSLNEQSVAHLRTMLIIDHIIRILQKSRSNNVVCNALRDTSSKDNFSRNELLDSFGILCNKSENSINLCDFESVRRDLETKILKSRYKKENKVDGDETAENIVKEQDNNSCRDIQAGDVILSGIAKDHEYKNNQVKSSSKNGPTIESERSISTESNENIHLNAEKFIDDSQKMKENDLPVLFDKSLKEIRVSSVWEDLLHLESLERKTRTPDITEEKRKVIHVFGQEKKFHIQKVALAWRMLTSSCLAEKQICLCHCSVAFFNNDTGQHAGVTCHELLRIRTKQVRNSYSLKYGSVVNDDNWTATITKMTVAVIKLEILLTPLKYQVKLDITDSDECPTSCRQALFVLYNCARLAKIMEHYRNAVETGLYPPLPDIDEIDFFNLKDESEWNLFMRYIVSYPDIIEQLAQSLEEPSMTITFNSNKIAQFLVSLSQDVSSYYSRVHILGEPRPHLFPVMFARLYLVKAMYQLMQNAFHLLNIETIDQM